LSAKLVPTLLTPLIIIITTPVMADGQHGLHNGRMDDVLLPGIELRFLGRPARSLPCLPAAASRARMATSGRLAVTLCLILALLVQTVLPP
jgi:hypothetical protein